MNHQNMFIFKENINMSTSSGISRHVAKTKSVKNL